MGDSIPRSRSSSICTDLKNHEQITDSFTSTSSAVSINSRILIVDDEQDIATLYKLSLEYNGFAVDAFNDPLVAFSNYKIATKRPLFCCLRLKLSLVSIPWNSYAVVIIVQRSAVVILLK